jgi:hypothetical protein
VAQAGLFSAVVTAFLIESYKGLSEATDTESATVVLLAQISSQLASIANSSQTFPNIHPLKPEFYPSAATLAVNLMWFLSLSLSLVCALAATLVQYWARNYTRSVERYQQSPLKRGLIRALMFEGLEKSHVGEIVEAIPSLIHVALFLFLTGLVTFLHDISLPIAYFVLAVLATCVILYGISATLPLFRSESALRTPFSSVLWFAWHYFSRFLPQPQLDIEEVDPKHFWVDINQPGDPYSSFLESKFLDDPFVKTMIQIVPPIPSPRYKITSISEVQEKAASVNGRLGRASRARMVRALVWIRGLANEDHEFEDFLAAIPGCSVWHPSLLLHLVKEDHQLLRDIREFFRKTIPYAWAPAGRVQTTRAVSCMEAMYHLVTAVSPSPLHLDLKWKMHQAPLLFVSDLAGYLEFCDSAVVSLVFCTMTVCLTIREPALTNLASETILNPELTRSRQYINQLLGFELGITPRSALGYSPASGGNLPPFRPFEFVIRKTLSQLSRENDRVAAYKHTLIVVEVICQAVQEIEVSFHQTSFVNFLEILLAGYSGNIEGHDAKVPETISGIINKMLTALLQSTRSLSDSSAMIQASYVLSKYLDSNPAYGLKEARESMHNIESRLQLPRNTRYNAEADYRSHDITDGPGQVVIARVDLSPDMELPLDVGLNHSSDDFPMAI